MDTFFCAQESRQAGEEPIGNAGTYQTYVLVECPPPWAAYAFDSKSVPSNLRAFKEEIEQTELSVRFLLIYSNTLKQDNCTKILIFRQPEGLCAVYSKQEIQVSSLKDVAPALRDYLAAESRNSEYTKTETRDILVCTHGSHDKCCAKYGNPFYRQALAIVANLSLNNVRIWQVSHFGGHRFAPTAIDFPSGRYYGRLDQSSFTSILTRTGEINCLNHVYRGWGMLTYPAQIMERELILMHGWD